MRQQPEPPYLGSTAQDDVDSDVWYIEDEAIICGLEGEVYELADCVELPEELLSAEEQAEADPNFEADWDEWFEYLHNSELLLPVEQSCGDDGLLLAWDMRGVRLRTLPDELLARLHEFFEECPTHTKALLVHHVFWLVRFERIRRRGSPRFDLRQVVIPDDEEPAFFRPNRLTVRFSGR